MSSNTTYNGWTNYETWLVNVHDIIDEETQRQLIKDCKSNGSSFYEEGYLAQALKEYVEDLLDDIGETPKNGFVNDMYRAAMSEVNWHELAGHYLADYEEEEEEPEEEIE